jgi:hypothetical protein
MFKLAKVSTLLALIGTLSMAAEVAPIDGTGRVFSLEPGVYEGSDYLVSEPFYIPKIHFKSTRVVKNGVIEAHTIARLLKIIKVGEAKARLKVVPTSSSSFDLLDADNVSNKVGSGQCHEDICTFSVTVMNGDLYLKESWAVKENSFEIVKGFQRMKGIESTYGGEFFLKN